jgi:hypothetical protein
MISHFISLRLVYVSCTYNATFFISLATVDTFIVLCALVLERSTLLILLKRKMNSSISMNLQYLCAVHSHGQPVTRSRRTVPYSSFKPSPSRHDTSLPPSLLPISLMSSKGWFNLEAAAGTIPETQFFEGEPAFKALGLTRTQRLYGFAGWYVFISHRHAC